MQLFESFYAENLHPWGEQPNQFVVDYVDELLPGTVLDLGAGDGRDVLFLARRGFHVIAVDAVDKAIAELRRVAAAEGLNVEAEVADIAEVPLAASYANIVSTLTLHLLSADTAPGLIARMKERTAPGGCHLLSLFTKDGPLYRPESKAFWTEPGGLRVLYEDWDVIHSARRITSTAAKDESGNPFMQPVDELVVRKPE